MKLNNIITSIIGILLGILYTTICQGSNLTYCNNLSLNNYSTIPDIKGRVVDIETLSPLEFATEFE